MKLSTPFTSPSRLSLLAASALLAMASSAMAQEVKEAYAEFEGGPLWLPDGGLVGTVRPGPTLSQILTNPTPLAGATVNLSFKGVSQFDLRNILGGSYIPPDTHGAIGASQYMETTNGVYGIYDKSTGALQSMQSAATFWTAAGATGGLNGDARIMYDSVSQKWIALQFGASVADIQIAVSTTSSATGAWKSTKFTGFAGGTADYPTLAIDSAGVYIGTNNFNSSNAYSGTTLNIISRADLFGATPTAANVVQFVTPYSASSSTNVDRGYAIQGVNSKGATSGRIIAAAALSSTGPNAGNEVIRYNIANPGTAGATQGAVSIVGITNYANSNNPAAQPDGTFNIDSFDQRIGASAWEVNGKIYSVYGATPVAGSHTEVRFLITNAATGAIIQEGSIGDGVHDYYQGSITVNSSGQVVIGYNRSGLSAVDGKVSVMARTYNSDAAGKLVQTNEILLHVSDVGNYHNGSNEGLAAVGRQRWGDYSSVTIDPTNDQNFWVIGEYAAPWNNAAGCTPAVTPGCTQTGGSTWGTWISEISLAAVPEPQTYLMMIAGLFAVGGIARRKAASTQV